VSEEEPSRLELEITKSTYEGDVHSSIPHAVYRGLEEGREDYMEVFGIENEQLNRYLSEGDETGSGWTVEDFAVSTSVYDGEIIVGQCVTGRGKENQYDRKQVMSLRYNLMNFHPETFERLKGSYVLAADINPEKAEDLEERVEEEIQETGSAEIEMLVKEIEDIPLSIEESTSMFWAD